MPASSLLVSSGSAVAAATAAPVVLSCLPRQARLSRPITTAVPTASSSTAPVAARASFVFGVMVLLLSQARPAGCWFHRPSGASQSLLWQRTPFAVDHSFAPHAAAPALIPH